MVCEGSTGSQLSVVSRIYHRYHAPSELLSLLSMQHHQLDSEVSPHRLSKELLVGPVDLSLAVVGIMMWEDTTKVKSRIGQALKGGIGNGMREECSNGRIDDRDLLRPYVWFEVRNVIDREHGPPVQTK